MEWLDALIGTIIGFVISWQVFNPKIGKAKADAEWEKGISTNLYKKVSQLEDDISEQFTVIGNLRKANTNADLKNVMWFEKCITLNTTIGELEKKIEDLKAVSG